MNKDFLILLGKPILIICILLQLLESCLQYSVTNYTVILNNTDRNTRREIGPFMFPEEQERAQILINSSDGSINENMHYHYHIRAYNRIGFSDSGTQEFSKWIMEVIMSGDSLPQEGGVLLHVFQVFSNQETLVLRLQATHQVDYSFNRYLDFIFNWLRPSNIQILAGRMTFLLKFYR